MSDDDELRLVRERLGAIESDLARGGNADSPAGQALLVQTCVEAAYPTASAGDEVQTVTSTATGGAAAWSWSGHSTGAIAYNASAATIQADLAALPGIGAGNVAATGGPLNLSPVVVTFRGPLANLPQPLISIGAGLTGGAAAVAETHKGSGPIWFAVQKITVLGAETEGNQGATSVDGDGTVKFHALNLGGAVPPVNAQVVVEWVDYAYVFRYDGKRA